jgi:clan AA aspartic protease
MGKVMQNIKLTNLYDRERARTGDLPSDQVRSVEIEALVDTGATTLVLPADVVERLGLPTGGHRKVRYADGRVEEVPWVAGVHIVILGRETAVTALVIAAGQMALIGQIPLEELDFVVDPKSRELRPNPRSPDAPILDLLRVA